jgi:hypothetical protein
LYDVGEDMKFDLLHEVELEMGEDAPMSMAAHMKVRNPSRVVFSGLNFDFRK